jgi:hypothetical protein
MIAASDQRKLVTFPCQINKMKAKPMYHASDFGYSIAGQLPSADPVYDPVYGDANRVTYYRATTLFHMRWADLTKAVDVFTAAHKSRDDTAASRVAMQQAHDRFVLSWSNLVGAASRDE